MQIRSTLALSESAHSVNILQAIIKQLVPTSKEKSSVFSAVTSSSGHWGKDVNQFAWENDSQEQLIRLAVFHVGVFVSVRI